jgi:hypothetical protein
LLLRKPLANSYGSGAANADSPSRPSARCCLFCQRERDDPAERAALDEAAEIAMSNNAPADAQQEARIQLAERQVLEAFTALEMAKVRLDTHRQLSRLAAAYQQALAAYEALCRTQT